MKSCAENKSYSQVGGPLFDDVNVAVFDKNGKILVELFFFPKIFVLKIRPVPVLFCFCV